MHKECRRTTVRREIDRSSQHPKKMMAVMSSQRRMQIVSAEVDWKELCGNERED